MGVKMAVELATTYSVKKEITLIMNGNKILQISLILKRIIQMMERDLQKLGVKLIRNAQVLRAETTAKGDEQTTLMLSNGLTFVTDLYLPLSGISANTRFVPSHLSSTQPAT